MSDDLITRDSLWHMMNGKFIRLCEMTDSHLLNAINVLRGRSPIGTRWHGAPERRHHWLNAMANELYFRDFTHQQEDIDALPAIPRLLNELSDGEVPHE